MEEIETIKALFNQWNEAIKSGDPKQVAILYDAEVGILLPTVSNQVCHNRAEIEAYFSKKFLPKQPNGEIDEANIRIFDTLAINSGLYTFTFGDGSIVPARYTFVYRKINEQWLIIEHHSSVMPNKD